MKVAMAAKPSGPVVHPSALVERGARLGAGTRVWQFAVVKRGARVGPNCNIGAHCYVEYGAEVGRGVTIKNDVAVWEGVVIEDGVMVGPNAVFTNDLYPRSQRLPQAAPRYKRKGGYFARTRLRKGCSVGAGAMILAGTTIGRFATVGLGAVVVKSVPDHALVVGNPARRIGWACECGLPLDAASGNAWSDERAWRCRGCRKAYRERSGALARSGR